MTKETYDRILEIKARAEALQEQIRREQAESNRKVEEAEARYQAFLASRR